MAWDFHVGMRVVCVGEGWQGPDAGEPRCETPKEGVVYTLRDVIPAPVDFPDFAKVYVRLEEIRNDPWPTAFGPFEPAFNAQRFRPVDETRLDVFRKLLTPTPQPEQVPA